jgi:hypothetical protein
VNVDEMRNVIRTSSALVGRYEPEVDPSQATLGSIGITFAVPQKKRGRPQKHESAADKQAAYRARQSERDAAEDKKQSDLQQIIRDIATTLFNTDVNDLSIDELETVFAAVAKEHPEHTGKIELILTQDERDAERTAKALDESAAAADSGSSQSVFVRGRGNEGVNEAPLIDSEILKDSERESGRRVKPTGSGNRGNGSKDHDEKKQPVESEYQSARKVGDFGARHWYDPTESEDDDRLGEMVKEVFDIEIEGRFDARYRCTANHVVTDGKLNRAACTFETNNFGKAKQHLLDDHEQRVNKFLKAHRPRYWNENSKKKEKPQTREERIHQLRQMAAGEFSTSSLNPGWTRESVIEHAKKQLETLENNVTSPLTESFQPTENDITDSVNNNLRFEDGSADDTYVPQDSISPLLVGTQASV